MKKALILCALVALVGAGCSYSRSASLQKDIFLTTTDGTVEIKKYDPIAIIQASNIGVAIFRLAWIKPDDESALLQKAVDQLTEKAKELKADAVVNLRADIEPWWILLPTYRVEGTAVKLK